MNAYGRESAGMKYSPLANFGKAELKHFGADTFMGHQELMGTLPKKPEAQPFQKNADSVADHGNDPLIGHSRHTREYVPLLLYKKEFAAGSWEQEIHCPMWARPSADILEQDFRRVEAPFWI